MLVGWLDASVFVDYAMPLLVMRGFFHQGRKGREGGGRDRVCEDRPGSERDGHCEFGVSKVPCLGLGGLSSVWENCDA